MQDSEKLADAQAWRYPNGPRMVLLSASVLLLLLLCGAFVYFTGGTKYVYAHIFYFPIIFAAFFFRVPGGLLTGLAAATILGPWMPLDVNANEMQRTVNWLTRGAMFILIGSGSGYASVLLNSLVDRAQLLQIIDSLTGLGTREFFLRELNRYLSDESGENLAILCVEASGYDWIRTSLGAEHADRLTRYMADRLALTCPDSIVSARVFGARFALALPVADQQAIEPWVSRIKELFQRPVDVRGIPLYADVVVGAAYHPNHGHRARDLLQKASTALLHARDLTGRFCAYRPALDNDYQETMFLLAELSLAFERKELSLHYQPIVELSSGRLMTVEALFRWKHPRRGWIPPVQVLPAAEETGLIEPLTDWALRTSLAQLKEWRAKIPELRVSVNISARNLANPRFAVTVKECLAEQGLPPDSLQLEITETNMMPQLDTALPMLRELHRDGVRLAIDDFGTGYSSLAYLSIIPVRTLKIDRSFIKGILKDGYFRELARATVELTNRLDLISVAEGIEDAETLQLLIDMGCQRGQGFYLSPPLPPEELLAWHERRASDGGSAVS